MHNRLPERVENSILAQRRHAGYAKKVCCRWLADCRCDNLSHVQARAPTVEFLVFGVHR
ncbi:hypothetical protein LT85_4778 [Collimonas arenae]|uniref:Uncharacterized protein n=1 Tax=Collimonas arenae TaxID=279058 RepID=A0A0A1FH83_9BURK|nr:hypothetical protein LT85_4778 [Collimonas arenae]